MEGVDNTPADYATLLRKIINVYSKLFGAPLDPGEIKPGCKSEGRTLPSGLINYATLLFNQSALRHLAVASKRGPVTGEVLFLTVFAIEFSLTCSRIHFTSLCFCDLCGIGPLIASAKALSSQHGLTGSDDD